MIRGESGVIKKNVIEPDSIVEFLLEGDADVDEILGVIQNQYLCISTGVLWNFVAGSNLTLSADDMQRIAQMVKKHSRHRKTAYLGATDVEFGLLRMYEVYAEMLAVQPIMKVFRSRDEAVEWLKEV